MQTDDSTLPSEQAEPTVVRLRSPVVLEGAVGNSAGLANRGGRCWAALCAAIWTRAGRRAELETVEAEGARRAGADALRVGTRVRVHLAVRTCGDGLTIAAAAAAAAAACHPDLGAGLHAIPGAVAGKGWHRARSRRRRRLGRSLRLLGVGGFHGDPADPKTAVPVPLHLDVALVPPLRAPGVLHLASRFLFTPWFIQAEDDVC